MAMQQQGFTIRSPKDAVSVGQPALDSFQGYQDAALDQANRMMQPSQDAAQRKFEQQMVNKGLDPGSKAYNLAQAQMQRGINDQNRAAVFDSMKFGLGAQQQAFGQGLEASKLAASESQFGRGLDERGRQFDEQLGQRSYEFDQNLGQRESEFGRNLGQRESEFGRNFGQQQYQYDRGQNFAENQGMFNNMMGMGNMAMALGSYQNQGLLQDYNMGQTLLGMAPGMMNQQVGVNNAYNTSMQGAQAQANLNMQSNANVMSGLGQMAGAAAFLSGQKYKRVYGETDPKDRAMIAAKILAMPIYDWDYLPEYRESGDKVRFGCMAEDFNGSIFDNEAEDTIDIQRFMAAMQLTMQEMFKEIQRLELMLWSVVNRSGVTTPNGKIDPEAGLIESYESLVEKAWQGEQ